MSEVINLSPKNKKDLIPLWVDHNDKFFPVPRYFIHKDEGDIYSSKDGNKANLKKLKNAPIYEDRRGSVYPRLQIFDPILFNDLNKNLKYISLHRTVVLSNIFHFNKLVEFIHKAFPQFTSEQIKNIPIEFLEIILRGLEVNHIDHNKENYHLSNLELTTPQGNSKASVEYQKKVAMENKKI